MTLMIDRPLIVKFRKNETQHTEGILRRIVPAIRHLPEQYGVEFPDSDGLLEWFDLEEIVTDPQQLPLL